MLEIDRKIAFFNIRETWFAERPSDLRGFDGVRFYACPNNMEVRGFRKISDSTLLIDLRQSLDEIWRRMGKSSCRYAINRASREGIQVTTNQDYEHFLKMTELFMKGKGLNVPRISRPFMERFGVLFLAKYKGEVIAGQFYLKDEKNLLLLVGSSKRLEPNVAKPRIIGWGNRLLVWEAIKYGKQNGLQNFDMGGYYSGNDKADPNWTVNLFKISFGGVVVQQYHFEKYYSKLLEISELMYRKVGQNPRLPFVRDVARRFFAPGV